MESTSYVLSFRMVFFYLVTMGWIFDISLYENSINQSINVFAHKIILHVDDNFFDLRESRSTNEGRADILNLSLSLGGRHEIISSREHI